MTPAAFASWLLTALEPDTWYTPEQAARKFQLAGATANPERILASATTARWLEWHPGDDAFCVASRCWWPRPKPWPTVQIASKSPVVAPAPGGHGA